MENDGAAGSRPDGSSNSCRDINADTTSNNLGSNPETDTDNATSSSTTTTTTATTAATAATTAAGAAGVSTGWTILTSV